MIKAISKPTKTKFITNSWKIAMETSDVLDCLPIPSSSFAHV